ncbi:MAG: NUDIX domain-containing protein [Chloroflexi bacterium]|nr:NUDIX domain-containing protein [Chloroflexota bacterium]
MGAQEQGANATQGRWLVIPRTLCFLVNGDDVLLMKRAPTKRVFPNRYNGVGGHIERYEDPLTSARREIEEETGINAGKLTLRAMYNIDTGEKTGIMLYVFVGLLETRQTRDDCAEGTLHWIPIAELDRYDLVEDLPHILPRILDGDTAPWFVHVSYDSDDRIVMRFAEEDAE